MSKHAAEVMSASNFLARTDFQSFSLKRLGRFVMGRTHPLQNIYDLLVQYEGIPKANIQRRHQLLSEIARVATEYAGPLPASERDNQKVKTVKEVAQQATSRLLIENQRALALAETMRSAPSQAVNVGSGHGPNLRFERVIKPGTQGIRGDELVEKAQSLGIELSREDNLDYYAMKKMLKIIRQKNPEQLILTYFGAEEREQYRLILHKDTNLIFDHRPRLFDTLSTAGVPARTAMYACNTGGIFYARNWNDSPDNRGSFHHSSFLAGAPALCAGTIKVRSGMLLEITNMSGHYSPKLSHLIQAAQVVWEDLQPNGAYVVFADFENVFQRVKSRHIRVPLYLFANSDDWRTDVEDFEVNGKSRDEIYHYVRLDKARERGCTEPDT